MAEICPVEIWSGYLSWNYCGRLIERDGLCGIHAAAKERAAQREEKARVENERRAYAREMADALTALGFECSTTRRGGEVVLHEPEKLVQKLRSLGG